MNEPKFELLSKDYVIKNGVLLDKTFSFECYGDNYEQLFDKPMDEGGKPVNGLVYDLFPDGALWGYTFYQNGYQRGDDVTFYTSGKLLRFSRYTDKENFIFEWYENGQLKMYKENCRPDVPHYYRSKRFDEQGRLTVQDIFCEVHFFYKPDSPDKSCNVTWHESGEFKRIEWLQPTCDDFYSALEFDEQGMPVDFEINPFYCPAYMSREKVMNSYNTVIFDDNNKNYKYDGGFLLKKYFECSWCKYSGKLAFLYNDQSQGKGDIEKILEFDHGEPSGEQYIYYKSGQLKEFYCISKGREYYEHTYWYESGTVREAVLYSHDMLHKCTVRFNEKGEETERTVCDI